MEWRMNGLQRGWRKAGHRSGGGREAGWRQQRSTALYLLWNPELVSQETHPLSKGSQDRTELMFHSSR